MKVLYLSRVDLFDARGGDTHQMENTRDALLKLSNNITIDISTSLRPKNIENYDIVHVFNIDWVCETYTYASLAKKYNKKLVLSAIHHSEDEVKNYEENSRYDFRRIINPVIRSQALRDELKNIYRSFSYPAKIIPTISQIINGIRNQQRKVIMMSDIVLVQTIAEANDIKKDFGVEDFKYSVVYNGVNIDVFVNASPDLFNDKFYKVNNLKMGKNRMILNVGRIEARKNQLTLIDAFKDLKKYEQFKDYVLVFIGSENTHHPEYLHRFRSEVGDNGVYYLGQQPPEFIGSAMKAGEIYVQPSYFETTGLVTLEAFSAGMKIVASGERIKEYLHDNAIYCDINDRISITNAIMKAKDLSVSSSLVMDIKSKYNWEIAAKQTLQVYRSLLS